MARRFPRGPLAEEREVLSIQALALSGDMDQARLRAATFVRAHRSSPHAPVLRGLVHDR